MKMRKETVVILFAFLITTVLFLASAWYVQFHVPLNDFWGVLYYARNLSLAERASLYNGFYPIGYPLLLKLFPTDGVIQAAFVSNVLLAGLLLASTAGLISLRDSFVAVAATGVGLLVHPLVVRYANTPGPDIGASAFVSCAVYFLWRDGFLGKDPPAHRMSGIVSGVFLGLASLWRSHAIVISVAIILSYVLVMGPRALWSRREIVLAFAFVYSLQVITNILSGHGPFETAQKFNIYKTFNGIDWGNIPGDLDARIRSFSFFRLMFEQPLQVIHIIGPAFLAIAVYALPVVPGLIISKDLLTIRFLRFTGLSIILYAFPVSLGASLRAPIAILSLSFLSVGFLFVEMWGWIKSVFIKWRVVIVVLETVLVVAGALWILGPWLDADFAYLLSARLENDTFMAVEERLVSQGMTSPRQVFTDDSSLFFPELPPYRPRYNGGWDSFALWGFRRENPELPLGSWVEFSEACSSQGITFLVLSDGSGNLAGFLGELYDGKFKPEGIKLTAKIIAKGNRYKIFQYVH
jgi:hypothetical protein